MRLILEKCEKDDFVYISTVLDSYLSFTNDKRRKELLALSVRPALNRNLS